MNIQILLSINGKELEVCNPNEKFNTSQFFDAITAKEDDLSHTFESFPLYTAYSKNCATLFSEKSKLYCGHKEIEGFTQLEKSNVNKLDILKQAVLSLT